MRTTSRRSFLKHTALGASLTSVGCLACAYEKRNGAPRATGNTNTSPRSYQWLNVTSKAAFRPRDGAGALVFKDRMWLIGGWNPFDSIEIGSQTFPLLILALLATGGSSFWKNILGYTKAVRDLRLGEKEIQFKETQKVRRSKKLSHSVARMENVLTEMEANGQPGF